MLLFDVDLFFPCLDMESPKYNNIFNNTKKKLSAHIKRISCLPYAGFFLQGWLAFEVDLFIDFFIAIFTAFSSTQSSCGSWAPVGSQRVRSSD